MTDGESARHRRNTPNASRAELMTDGAIRCRLLLLKVRPLKCHSRFPTIRRVPTGWLPRCRFKAMLRVVSPTNIPEHGVVGWLTRLEQSVRLPSRSIRI